MDRILLIDDDDKCRTCVREVLKIMGYTCLEAHNGKTALDLIQHVGFGLVITDNQMPTMSGLDLLERMHISPSLKKIPTILLTGNLSEAVRIRALRAGVNQIFGKPYNYHDLVLAVDQLLSHKEVDSPSSSPSPSDGWVAVTPETNLPKSTV